MTAAFTLTGNAAGLHKVLTSRDAFPTAYQPYASNDDVLYAVVKRTINGKTVRYIERMHTRPVQEEA